MKRQRLFTSTIQATMMNKLKIKLEQIVYNKDKIKKRKGDKKMLNVIIKDFAGDNNYNLKLSEEQYNLLEWLINEELLLDVSVEIFEGIEFKEI